MPRGRNESLPRIETVSGRDAAFARHVPDIARLRIAVFREFPYLYAGSVDYEQRYLATYARCAESVVVLARDGDTIVGASTGIPLTAETAEFQQPFLDHGIDPREIFYCGESVLLPAWRGKGIYRAFFAERERHARALGGFRRMAFCAVVRASDHPLRPADHVPLDAIWRHFGYQHHPEFRTLYEWPEIDAPESSAKEMEFWMKPL